MKLGMISIMDSKDESPHWNATNGVFAIGARQYATKICTMGKMFHISQQKHGSHCAIKASARTKC